jgi:hypothetical protein
MKKEAVMANLQIKGIDEGFYQQVKQLARSQNRTVSQQVLHCLQLHTNQPTLTQRVKTPAQVLLELSGGWQDNRNADEIIADLRQSRNNSTNVAEL